MDLTKYNKLKEQVKWLYCKLKDGVTDAPSDGNKYLRQNSDWVINESPIFNQNNIFTPYTATLADLEVTKHSEVTAEIVASYIAGLNLNITDKELFLLEITDNYITYDFTYNDFIVSNIDNNNNNSGLQINEIFRNPLNITKSASFRVFENGFLLLTSNRFTMEIISNSTFLNFSVNNLDLNYDVTFSMSGSITGTVIVLLTDTQSNNIVYANILVNIYIESNKY